MQNIPNIGLDKVAKLLTRPGRLILNNRGDTAEFFNPEEYITHKREWNSRRELQAESNSEAVVVGKHDLIDYFCVVGLEKGGEESLHMPDILFSYPESLPEDLRREIPSYCYPNGLSVNAVQRASQAGAVNDIVYGQHYDLRSDQSFIFQLQTSTSDGSTAPETLYGICFYRKEFVHRLPVLMRQKLGRGEKEEEEAARQDELPSSLWMSNRCYCILSRVPLFEQHFEMLRKILSFERHYQIHEFVKQVDCGLWNSTTTPVSQTKSSQNTNEETNGFDDTVSSFSDSETLKPQREEEYQNNEDFDTPEDVTALDFLTPSAPLLDGPSTEYYTARTRAPTNSRGSVARTMSRYEHVTKDEEIDIDSVRRNLTMMTIEKDLVYFSTSAREDQDDSTGTRKTPEGDSNTNSLELGSWIEASNAVVDDASFQDTAESKHMSPPQETRQSPFPSSWEHPLHMLEAYKATAYDMSWNDSMKKEIQVPGEISLKNTHGESMTAMCCNMTELDFLAAQQLQGWAICCLCRHLSVYNIINYIGAMLLERQIVVFNPNPSVVSGIVLSTLPLLTPFSWQSLMLPILPNTPEKIHLLDAPVPFIVGSASKTKEIRNKCASLLRVNAYKDNIKNAHLVPKMPGFSTLALSLYEIHDSIRYLGIQNAAESRPLYQISEEEAKLASTFAATVSSHLMGLTSDLAGYMITDVSAPIQGSNRCSVLLKESFVESFDDPKDREFMSEFVETQLFDMYTDCFQ
ncbi:hypothetical protein M9434_000547 [Picochlorum sp. BPE23]|nr:hypothetical protein M9434_000547 [Picochlorum sp. BPE23]